MQPELTDTQKIRIIPQLRAEIDELYRIIVTGDTISSKPGLMEIIRNTDRNVEFIKLAIEKDRRDMLEMEKRIKAIEERHKIVDAEKEIAKEQFIRREKYTIVVWAMVVTNIGIILMNLLGVGK